MVIPAGWHVMRGWGFSCILLGQRQTRRNTFLSGTAHVGLPSCETQGSGGQCLKWRIILGDNSGRWNMMIGWDFSGELWKTVWPLGFIFQNRIPKLVLRKSYFYLHQSLKSNDQIGGSTLELQVEAMGRCQSLLAFLKQVGVWDSYREDRSDSGGGIFSPFPN